MREPLLNLIIKGYHHINSKEDFCFIEPIISNIDWVQDADINYRYINPSNEIDKALSKTSELLLEKYIKHIDKCAKIGYKSIWNGTEISSCKWHNDLKEGPNICFLMYLSDIRDNCGGQIEIRRKSTKEITGSVTPKKYDIVMFSQELEWEHRVSPFRCDSMERITTNIGFYVKWI